MGRFKKTKSISMLLAVAVVANLLPASQVFAADNSDYKQVSENGQVLNAVTKQVEKPCVTGMSRSSTSIGSRYEASITLRGQARRGNTVFIKCGGETVEHLIDKDNNFSFSIETRSRKLTVELYSVDKKGNKSETVTVNINEGDYDTINNGTTPSSNEDPVINASDRKIRVGDTFDPKDKVTATDAEDGDLTNAIQIVENNVNASVIGKYKVVYKVQDSDENVTTKEIEVNVVERTNTKPQIKGAEDKTIKVGDSFDPKEGVSAWDEEDEDLTSKIEVKGNVDTTKVGEYTLTYSVTDSDKNTVTATRKVTVAKRDVEVKSLIGSDRYDTAAQLCKSKFNSADTVVIVNGTAMVDGLTVTPLATYKNAPILLTRVDSVPEYTKNEIKRLGAKNAIIVGGTTVVSDNVSKELKALGISSVERLGGKDRYETSLLIAKNIDANCYDVSDVVISGGNGEADALSIASVAGNNKMPIILVESNEVSLDTYNWINSESINNAYIIGGTTVVNDNVMAKLNEITATDISGNRLGGKDRYETNALVINKFYGKDLDKVYIAKGLQLVDALSAGPVAALDGAPVVLAGSDLSVEQQNVLNAKSGNTILRTGGGIPDAAVNTLKACLK